MDKVLECQPLTSHSKHAKAVIVEEEETENIHSRLDLFPHEIALSFDHILEEIFSFLDTSDLFTCRLVSHRFLKFTQIPLGNKIEFIFYNYELQIRDCSDSPPKKSSRKSLQQLTEFLEGSPTFSTPESSTSLNTFPCTDFYFQRIRLGDDVLQNFLNVNGSNIRKLSVFPGSKKSTHENILMDQLVHLLTSQAPFLQYLWLILNPKVEWQKEEVTRIQGSITENVAKRSYLSPLLPTDPEFQQITSRVKSLPKKSCLKVLQINGNGLAKVLELLFQISPKLQEVIMHESSYMHLLYPVSRVHLLRSLELEPKIDYPKSSNMETMEKISKEKNLGLKKLAVNFNTILPVCLTHLEFEKRLVSITNRILERSRDTLKSLSMSSTSFLWGMKMPSCMTQVRNIQIEEFDERHGTKATIFPKEFSLSETFPKLSCVKLSHFAEFMEPNGFHEFLNCLDFQGDNNDPTLSLSVNKVVLSSGCFYDPETEAPTAIPTNISQRVHRFFPNARIEAEM